MVLAPCLEGLGFKGLSFALKRAATSGEEIAALFNAIQFYKRNLNSWHFAKTPLREV